jgi:hypothetical protein
MKASQVEHQVKGTIQVHLAKLRDVAKAHGRKHTCGGTAVPLVAMATLLLLET